MKHLERTNGDYIITSDKALLQPDVVTNFLFKAGWVKDKAIVPLMIAGSLTFGVYHFDQQIGFARVVTDYATVAIIADVFILEGHRGKGLGKWLVASLLGHPDLIGVTWLLTTSDAHGLYRKFGFTEMVNQQHFMYKPPSTDR